jgi:hypothetical protein
MGQEKLFKTRKLDFYKNMQRDFNEPGKLYIPGSHNHGKAKLAKVRKYTAWQSRKTCLKSPLAKVEHMCHTVP